MLKEVQVPPALFLSIIGFYVSLTTFRTGKSASSRKIDPDVEEPIKTDLNVNFFPIGSSAP